MSHQHTQQYSFKDVINVINAPRNSFERIKQMAQEQPSIIHLMGCGGDPLVCLRHGWTVLHEAAKIGAVEICNYFVSWGADSELEDELSLTPMTVAVWASNADVVRVFLKHGANPNRKDSMFGDTPLHYAMSHDRTGGQIVRLLLDAGAKKSINAQDKDGQTPLHHAAYGDLDYRMDNAKILISCGADAEIADKTGKTALDKSSGALRKIWVQRQESDSLKN